MQEGPIGAALHPPPSDKAFGNIDAAARLVVVEGEDAGQIPVHGRRRPLCGPAIEHDHVLGRGAQRRHEPRQVLGARLVPGQLRLGEELEPQLQADGMGTDRLR